MDFDNQETATLALRYIDRLLSGEGAYGMLLDSILSGTLAALAVHRGAWEVGRMSDRALSAIGTDVVSTIIQSRLEEISKKRDTSKQSELERGRKGSS